MRSLTGRGRSARKTGSRKQWALLDPFSAKGARGELFRVHISWSGRVVALIQTFQDKIPVGWDEVFVQWRSRSSWNRHVYHQKSHIRFPRCQRRSFCKYVIRRPVYEYPLVDLKVPNLELCCVAGRMASSLAYPIIETVRGVYCYLMPVPSAREWKGEI